MENQNKKHCVLHVGFGDCITSSVYWLTAVAEDISFTCAGQQQVTISLSRQPLLV